MKRTLVSLLVLVLVVSLVSPALGAKGGIKGKPAVLPARPGGAQTEDPLPGKRKGWQRFELQGTVTGRELDGDKLVSFNVKMKSGSKSIRRYYKRGDEITMTVDENTKYKPKKFSSDPASVLIEGRRVKVRGQFETTPPTKQDKYKAIVVVVRGLKSL